MAGPDASASEPEWLALLRAEVAKGRTIAAVAREAGMARPSLSMLLSGTYPAASLDRVTAKHEGPVLARLRDQVPCPHLRRGIGRAECRAHASAPMSASDPARLRQWAACRGCALNPLRGETA
jgi:hypothetical protein